MRERLHIYAQFALWFFFKKTTIKNSLGQVVCPLMVASKTYMKDEVLTCDIPSTRERFMQGQKKACCTSGVCVPREHYTEFANQEANKRPTFKIHTLVGS